MELSLIIPTYNEEKIAGFLDPVFKELVDLKLGDFEIIIADDSNSEHKQELADYCENKSQFRIVDCDNRGKGDAIKKAVLRSSGKIVIFMDADLSVSLAHLAEFVEIVRSKEADVVIGERPAKRNILNPLRFFLSFGLLVAQRLLIFNSLRYADTQCGFKAFAGDVIRSFARKQQVEGGMYDIEYLYMAKLNRFLVKQVPVKIEKEQRPTKIRLLRCAIFDPLDLMKIKWNGILGRLYLKSP